MRGLDKDRIMSIIRMERLSVERNRFMKQKPVISVERILDILETLAAENDGFPLTKLAKRITLPNSTAHRLLFTLTTRGYVEQDSETGRYRLTPKVLQISAGLLRRNEVRRNAFRIMEKLAQETGESVRLAVLNEGKVIYIECIQSTHTLQVRGFAGKEVFVHASAVGKVLLAHLPDEEQDRIIREGYLPKCTDNTITDFHKLGEHLRKVKEQGFAIDNEEGTIGSRCIAAPIHGHSGKVVAALSIAAPSVRITPKDFDRFIQIVRETSGEISRRLGCPSSRICGGEL